MVNFTFAQDAAPKLFHFGLKVSPTLAWMKSNVKELKNEGVRVGFSYGLITEFGFTKNYAFGTGVDITYRGGKMTYTGSDTSAMLTSTNIYKLQYVEVPLTLKMKTNQIGPMVYFGQIGVAPGFAIRTKGDMESVFSSAIDTIAGKFDNGNADVNKLNLSMIISLGLEYNLGGSTNLLVAVTFNNGFTNVLKDVDEVKDNNETTTKINTISPKESFDQKAASNYVALTVGILF